MPDAVNYIVLAIPVFFLLIGVEIIIDKMRKTGYYRLNDAISNINAGITEQVTSAFLKAFVVGIYAWLFDHYRFFEIPSNIFTWVILFIGVDFFYYWFHRYAHEINFLWGGHVVHHQSEEYNLSVALRQGAFQKFGSFAFYLPLALIGFNPVMFIVVSQFQTLYQFWIHTKTINRFPTPVEFIFNTPSHHRVHHGRNPEYIDKNHGGTLIIWDRMFGTFREEKAEVVYGITKPLNSWNPLRVQLDFWKDLIYDLSHTRKLGDKFKLLFYPPGWFPEELGGPKYAPEISISNAAKFNTTIANGLNYYVLIQFLIVLGLSSVFLFSFHKFGAGSAVVFMTFILFSITSLGIILENRKIAMYIEIVRLIVTVIIYRITIQNIILADPENIYFYIIIAWSVISFLFFLPFRRTLTR